MNFIFNINQVITIKKTIFLFLIVISQSIFADTQSDSDKLFDWAETQYRQYFSPTEQASQISDIWYYRYYPSTNNYLGTNVVDLDVYVLGDAFGGLLRVDTLDALMMGAGIDVPYYFIAIHLEPWNVARIADNYPNLENMVIDANQYSIKLTIMFSAQWADYILENNKMGDITAWRNQGHEIAIHHHSVNHQSWDGYSAYTEEEAIAKRIGLGHIPPEKYLGTLEDFMIKIQFLNANANSGCANEESDKMAMPNKVVYATCSGFQNFGTPGTEMNDLNPDKGKNKFISTAFVNGIQRKWLAHFQLFKNPNGAQQVFNSLDSDKIYGVAMHNENLDVVNLAEYLEFLNLKDPTAEKSKTVTEIFESELLPEEQM